MITIVGQWIRKGCRFRSGVHCGVSLGLGISQTGAEMDPGIATSAMALLGGGLALIAGRKRNK